LAANVTGPRRDTARCCDSRLAAPPARLIGEGCEQCGAVGALLAWADRQRATPQKPAIYLVPGDSSGREPTRSRTRAERWNVVS
jgi:hypothetical protein